MKLQVLAIRDRQLQAYGHPFYAPTIGAGTRSFVDAVNEKGSPMNSHPEDYELWWLGEFDDHTGNFLDLSNTDGKKAICFATNVKQ